MIFEQIEFGTPEYDEAVRLRYDVLREPLGLEFFAEDLAKEWADIHFCCYDNRMQLLGYMMLRVNESEPQYAVMKQVAVKKDVQKHGVGTFMVQQFEDYCRKNNFLEIHLHARDIAVPFYERLDYQKVGELFYEVGIEHYSMVKRLSKILSPQNQ